jgi:hypothetical protein
VLEACCCLVVVIAIQCYCFNLLLTLFRQEAVTTVVVSLSRQEFFFLRAAELSSLVLGESSALRESRLEFVTDRLVPWKNP